jgi:diguanylate cyclase (GGDEF)-like protein/PAS domain S-box-containing protein
MILGEDGLGRGFEKAAAGMSLVDEDRRYRWVNEEFCAMLGRSAEMLLAMGALEVMHPDHVERAATFYGGLLVGSADSAHDRFRYARPDQSVVWAEVGGTLMPATDGPRLILVQQLDVTAAQLMADALAHRAMHDDLTGLANRALLRDRLSAVLARARRAGTHGVAFYLDVDRFKSVNDTYGHAAGDEVLREVARRLAGVVRGDDTVARVGGDEFVVAGEVAGPAEATQLAERVGSALRPKFPCGPQLLPLTVSFGIALSVPEDRPDDLVTRADLSLLSTKRRRPSKAPSGGRR